MNSTLRRAAMLILTCASSAFAAPLPVEQGPAYAALMHGRVEEAAALLRQAVAANANDGAAHLLLCRAALAQEQPDAAVDECTRAASAAPTDAETQMWLGRALGLKAEHSNPMAAYSLAKRVRTAFERAHQFAPADAIIASDLGQFYIGAPAFLGGGADKLTPLAASMMRTAPARAHRLLGLLAAKNKDFSKAEAEFKAAIDAGHTPESYTDLALFYQQNDRPDQALASIRQGFAATHSHGPAEMDAASILMDAKRDPALAESALRDYLRSDNQTDASPVFRAHLLLGTLLKQRGDKGGAHAEFAAAVQLAPNYEPARKALKST